jgi:hypothetical protein
MASHRVANSDDATIFLRAPCPQWLRTGLGGEGRALPSADGAIVKGCDTMETGTAPRQFSGALAPLARDHADHPLLLHALTDYTKGLDLEAERCVVCELRDVWDRLVSLRWLYTSSVRARAALGVTCCPLHAWRLYEVSHGSIGTALGSSARTFELISAQSHVPPSPDSVHRRVSQLFARTVDVLTKQFGFAERQLERARTNWLLSKLPERRPHGLLWACPSCVLCARLPDGETAVFALLSAFCDAVAPRERALVAVGLCPRDRRIASASLARFSEFALLPHRAPARQLPSWWDMPAPGGEDLSFVRRLLEADDIIHTSFSGMCPACSIRASQERDILEKITAESRQVDQGTPTYEEHLGGEIGITSVGEADFCPRHTTLLGIARVGRAELNVRGQQDRVALPSHIRPIGAIPPAGQLWETGSLSSSSLSPGCLICRVLQGWNLARMEGLSRASGATIWSAETALWLREVLQARGDWFCLPHWQRATASAPAEVTATLLPAQLQHVQHLRALTLQHQLDHSRDRPDTSAHDARNGARANRPAVDDICSSVALAVGGYPH